MPVLSPGDPAPWFVGRTTSNPKYHFDSVAGRYVVLCFLGTGNDPGVAHFYRTVRTRTDVFHTDHALFFGVSIDPEDVGGRRLPDARPAIRWFWDTDGRISRRYGALGDPLEGQADDESAAGDRIGPGSLLPYRRMSYVLDRNLRVLARIPVADLASHGEVLVRFLEQLPRLPVEGRVEGGAPVLRIPHIFEPAFCRELIALYERHGGRESGTMRSDDQGRTIGVLDHGFKRRRDHNIEDETVKSEMRRRIHRRLVPEIRKAYAFHVTRIERYIVACYDSESGGFFRPHRDNSTKGTAHRRFAVTINLNAEDYDGGDLRFPEYDGRSYRASTGGAVVFSCSMLHEVTPITRGRRYCTLPFLYDDAAAEIRTRNLGWLAENAALGPPPPSEGTDAVARD